MKVLMKLPLIVALVNLTCALVCTIIGKLTGSWTKWVFFIFDPVYMTVSGVISFIAILLALGLIVCVLLDNYKQPDVNHKGYAGNIGSIVLNIIYICYYSRFLAF